MPTEGKSPDHQVFAGQCMIAWLACLHLSWVAWKRSVGYHRRFSKLKHPLLHFKPFPSIQNSPKNEEEILGLGLKCLTWLPLMRSRIAGEAIHLKVYYILCFGRRGATQAKRKKKHHFDFTKKWQNFSTPGRVWRNPLRKRIFPLHSQSRILRWVVVPRSWHPIEPRLVLFTC